MRRSVLALFAVALTMSVMGPTVGRASVVTYNIDVTVTSAPNAPGLVTPWTFGALPQVFHGTFDADDTVAGNISNLQLVVGGVDVAASHPTPLLFPFNPTTLDLRFTLLKLGPGFVVQSGLFFGDFTPGGPNAPSNYVLAFDDSTSGPLDPYYNSHYNWSGTFVVSAPGGAAIPEPSTWILSLIGIMGLTAYGRRKIRRVSVA